MTSKNLSDNKSKILKNVENRTYGYWVRSKWATTVISNFAVFYRLTVLRWLSNTALLPLLPTLGKKAEGAEQAAEHARAADDQHTGDN